MASFSVPDLNAFDPELFLTEPSQHGSVAYGDSCRATLLDPAGELNELVEEPRATP